MTDLDAIRARAERSHDEIVALCEGRRRWTMRVPAVEDRDSDLVLEATVTDVLALVEEVQRLRNGIDRLRQATTELALYTAIDELAGIYRTGGDRTLPGEE